VPVGEQSFVSGPQCAARRIRERRQASSEFFTSLREQVDLESKRSDLTAEQREGLRPLLNQRDDLITLLARSDPTSADRLAEIYLSFRKAMGTVH
jgi:hypothetical protein